MMTVTSALCAVALSCAAATGCSEASTESARVDPLPSWYEGPSKQALVSFVARVTTQGSPDFVPPAERIAVFDNDGTLWVEQPMYTQLAFAIDRVEELAGAHPDWADRQPFKGILEGNLKAAASAGERAALEIIAATHTGMTNDEFTQLVARWLETARHPTLLRPYTRLVYQPMLELLAYLRANGFTTFIVSGGGVEFIRPWAERVYGIPPQQVIGSRVKYRYETTDGRPALFRLAEVDLVDDKAGKPVGIQQGIGRRPILAVGNSDGDFEMLEWTTSRTGPHLGVVIHHTDAARELAYDRDAHFGRLARALDAAPARGWIVVDMKREWRRIFPP